MEAAKTSKGRPPRVADVALPLVARMVANAGCQGHKALSLAVHSKLPFVSMVRLNKHPGLLELGLALYF